MRTKLSHRQWEDLSAYLDGHLSVRDKVRIERSLEENPQLQRAFDNLRRTQQMIRDGPRLRVPRNFTLTTEMVGISPIKSKQTTLFPVFSFVSTLAVVLFILVLIGDLYLGIGESVVPLESQEPLGKSIAVEEVQPQLAPLTVEGGGINATAPEEIKTEMPLAAEDVKAPESATEVQAQTAARAIDASSQEYTLQEVAPESPAESSAPSDTRLEKAEEGGVIETGFIQRLDWLPVWILQTATVRALEFSLLTIAVFAGLIALFFYYQRARRND